MRQVVHVSDTLDSQSRGGAGYVMIKPYPPLKGRRLQWLEHLTLTRLINRL